jgi:hypothetical protein
LSFAASNPPCFGKLKKHDWRESEYEYEDDNDKEHDSDSFIVLLLVPVLETMI